MVEVVHGLAGSPGYRCCPLLFLVVLLLQKFTQPVVGGHLRCYWWWRKSCFFQIIYDRWWQLSTQGWWHRIGTNHIHWWTGGLVDLECTHLGGGGGGAGLLVQWFRHIAQGGAGGVGKSVNCPIGFTIPTDYGTMPSLVVLETVVDF